MPLTPPGRHHLKQKSFSSKIKFMSDPLLLCCAFLRGENGSKHRESITIRKNLKLDISVLTKCLLHCLFYVEDSCLADSSRKRDRETKWERERKRDAMTYDWFWVIIKTAKQQPRCGGLSVLSYALQTSSVMCVCVCVLQPFSYLHSCLQVFIYISEHIWD